MSSSHPEVAARPDLRMPLLGLAAWAGALLGHPGAPWWAPALAATVAVAAAVAVRHRSTVLLTLLAGVLVALAVGGIAWLRAEAIGTGPVAELAQERAVVSLTGRVTSDPRATEGRFHDLVVLRLSVTEVTGRGARHRLSTPVLVLGEPGWTEARLGATVRTSGRLVPADDPDLAALLTSAEPPEVVAGPDLWWRGAGAVRAAIRDAVAHRPPDQRALVPALVDGDDADLPPDLEDDFRTTGLTHLTAVSGTNLTLVVGFLLLLARWGGVRGRWLLLVGALGIVGFVLLARTEPSVVRAAAMGTVGLLALGSNGRHRALRGLGVAVVGLLLLQPGLAVTAGFALSVLATAGIVLLAPGWRDLMSRWLPHWLAAAVSVPAAAQLACTPVVAAISGEVSLVAVVANLVVAPAVAPATVLGLLAGLVGLLVAGLDRLIGTAAGWCVGWIATVARRGADLPTASVQWGDGPLAVAVLTGLCLLLVALAPLVLARPVAMVLVTATALVVVLVPAPTPGWPPRDWAAVMCDVGQGDALVLRAGPGTGVVVDTGPAPDAVDDCLDRLGITSVPLLVLTHFHADHVDGLAGVLDDRTVGRVLTTRVLDPPTGVASVAALLRESGVPASTARAGTTRRYGDVALQTLWPPPGRVGPGAGDGTDANDASVVALAEVAGLRVLLTGDLEPAAQAALARRLPPIDVDVLKVPHHGSPHQDESWLLSLRAEVALVPVGADNGYGHPSDAVLARLERSGALVRRTDLAGDIAVTSTGRVHTRNIR